MEQGGKEERVGNRFGCRWACWRLKQKKKNMIKVCAAWWGWTLYTESRDVLAWACLGLSLMPALCLA